MSPAAPREISPSPPGASAAPAPRVSARTGTAESRRGKPEGGKYRFTPARSSRVRAVLACWQRQGGCSHAVAGGWWTVAVSQRRTTNLPATRLPPFPRHGSLSRDIRYNPHDRCEPHNRHNRSGRTGCALRDPSQPPVPRKRGVWYIGQELPVFQGRMEHARLARRRRRHTRSNRRRPLGLARERRQRVRHQRLDPRRRYDARKFLKSHPYANRN